MGKKCQICEGAIVNGRCKLCGMIYRNDEEMYHVNEDRKMHYNHASRKVQQTMRQQERALPDQRAMENPQAEQSLAELLKKKSKEIQKNAADHAHAEQKKRLQPKDGVFTTHTSKPSSAETDAARKNKVIILIVLAFVVMELLVSCAQTLPYKLSGSTREWNEEEQKYVWSKDYIGLDEALADTLEGKYLEAFYLSKDDGDRVVNENSLVHILYDSSKDVELPEGYYMAQITRGEASLIVEGEHKPEKILLNEENTYAVFQMEEGDVLNREGAGNPLDMIIIYPFDAYV